MPEHGPSPQETAVPPPRWWASRLPWLWAALVAAALWRLRGVSVALTGGPGGLPIAYPLAAGALLPALALGAERWCAAREARRRAAALPAADRTPDPAGTLGAVGTLAAGVAHEINNPLSYVVANLAHLRGRLEGLPDPEGTLRLDVLEPLAEAEDGARRVRDVVRQLGAFARPDEACGPVDPARVLRMALATAPLEVRQRARIVTDLAPTPPVVASEARLGQVFLHLLVNAAQAIPEGNAEQHEIRVTLSCASGEVVAEFADTGQGMTAATRARIFEPYFTTRAPGGSGLGLAISHATVSRLGGRIDVESAPGQGSRFRVVLPAARRAVGPAPPAGPVAGA